MTTQEANARLVRDLKAVVEDAEELLHATADLAGEKIKEVRARLSTAVDAAKQSCHDLEEKSTAALQATDRCIREHPYETIGVAFGVGLVIGVLVGRR